MDAEATPPRQHCTKGIFEHRPLLRRTACCCAGFQLILLLVFTVALTSLVFAGFHSKIFEHRTPLGVVNRSSQTGEEFELLRGVNLGGWLVLEPWIVPSLFFQFRALEKPAIDEKTFCEVLGAEEANRQLTTFRDAWVTEQTFKTLAAIGLNAVRIPYGYWIYGDRPEFCQNVSSIEYLDKAVAWAGKHGLRVHLDLHGTMRSANGLDNSGESFRGKYADKWHGGSHKFDATAWKTGVALNVTVSVMARTVKRYANQSHVVMFGLVNEPLYRSIDECSSKRGCPFSAEEVDHYYQTAYNKTKEAVGEKMAARLSPVLDMDQRARAWDFTKSELWPAAGKWGAMGDVHNYFAFWTAANWLPQAHFLRYTVCNRRDELAWMHENALPTFVGEWSLAVTDCQGWLSGGYGNDYIWSKWGIAKCGHVQCPNTYGELPANETLEGNNGAPPGQCPVDPFRPPWGRLDFDEFHKTLALYQMRAYERSRGWFFWNFQCEIDDPRWCFMSAYDRGWFPRNLSIDAYSPPDVPHCENWDTPFGSILNAFLVTGSTCALLLLALVLTCLLGSMTWCLARCRGEPFLRPVLFEDGDAESSTSARSMMISLQHMVPTSWRSKPKPQAVDSVEERMLG